MKKNFLSLAALLIASAAFVACSGSDNDSIIDEPQPVNPTGKYTLTINATKGSGDAATRALIEETDEETHKRTLNATWATTENVYVMKVVETTLPTLSGPHTNYIQTWAIGSLSPQADGETATLTGTISGLDIADGDELTLQFPCSGDLDYTGQDGTLATIASSYDYATAKITVASVDGSGNIKISSSDNPVEFTNQQAIVRFTLLDKAGNAINPTELTVSPAVATARCQNDGSLVEASTNLTITPDGSTNVVYAALRGVDNRDLTLTATVGDDTYTYSKSGVTFENGKFYDIAVKMAHTPKTYNLAEATGDVTLRDGDTATGEMTGHTLYIADGATVTLSGASVTGSDNGAIRCLGNATILLADGMENEAKAKEYISFSAVHWPDGKTLTISGGTAGTGTLIADGTSAYGAGIGGGAGHPCGALSITGGVITATGDYQSAGIGAATQGHCGKITISGGNVTAKSLNHGAGIGAAASSDGSYCDAILISGGTVTATGKGPSAGIGYAGSYKATSVTITGDITRVEAARGSSGTRCISNSSEGSAKIDGKTISSQYFEDLWVDGLPEFDHLNLAERDYYKDALTWTLTQKPSQTQ